MRNDYPQEEAEAERRHIVIRNDRGTVVTREVPLDYFGDLQTEYEKRNRDYMDGRIADFSGETTSQVSPRTDSQTASPADVRTALQVDPQLQPSAFKVSPVPCSAEPIIYDQTKCIGCNRCAAVCQCDILLPSEEKGQHPVVMYPGECYYCGACVMVCPRPGAIRLSHPLMNRAKFVPVKQDGA